MATIDLTSKGNFSETKVYSVASAILNKDHFSSNDTVNAASPNLNSPLTLFRLPEKCLVTQIYVNTIKAANAGTQLRVGLHGYNDDIGSFNTDTSQAAAVKGFSSAQDIASVGIETVLEANSNVALLKDTGTGLKVSVRPEKKITDGQFVIIVEYIEYDTKTGSFTTYTPGT